MKLAAWGKTDKTGGPDGPTHHLAHHSMDVAAVFQHLLKLPTFRRRAEQAAGMSLSRQAVARLGAVVFLHDIGKLHPGFQAKGWQQGIWDRPLRGHVPESSAFLELSWKWSGHPFHETCRAISGWGDWVSPLLAASLSHHGRPIEHGPQPSLEDWDRPNLPQYSWRAEAKTMTEGLRRWFHDAFAEDEGVSSNEPRFIHFIAGLAALADWVGSDRRFFEFVAEFDSNYDKQAHQRAARAVREIGLDVESLPRRPDLSFSELTEFAKPNPAQERVGEVGTDHQLVILEAETGSGKTEAALWRFARLFSDGCVEGLYFAVPTRAAARQLHGRVHRAMKKLFGNEAPDAVLAIPGMLAAGETTGQRLPDWEVLWEDREGTVPARWAAEHATRFLAATVAVGTVDQAMLAGLMVKHAHLRGSALSRSLLVIDEVHASDAYMTAILKNLLDSHLAVGGYAMLMSATLGSRARVRWTGETPPDFDAAVNTHYPAVWMGGEKRPKEAGGAGNSKVVRAALDQMTPQRAAELALEAANAGARVLVVHNTVGRAIETWRAVQESGGAARLLQVADGPALHHGRFAPEDRATLDHAVEGVLAPDSNRKRDGVIVIGTQTLEQSLDIDADFLITDLCPIDVLLQRIGRLHRHSLRRPPGYDEARVIVMTPEEGLDRLTGPAFDNGLGAWERNGEFHGIYRDLAVLELTRRLIQDEPLWRIPEMNRHLVESATHRERIDKLIAEKGDAWRSYDMKHGGVEAAERMLGGLQRLDREKPYEKTEFPSSDEKIMTRLGEEGVVLELDSPHLGPFGNRVARITLPAHWSVGISSDEAKAVKVSPVAGELVLAVGEREFLYSRAGLERCQASSGADEERDQ